MKTSIRFKLILADDHILLREALANLLNNFDEFNVIAAAGNGEEVIQKIKEHYLPDIVLMDLNMPKLDGYETAKWLANHHPNIKVVILTMYDSEIALIRLLKAGVAGFLKKDIHPTELKSALLTIGAGEYYYSNHTTVKITSLFKADKALQNAILSDAEIEFLKLASTEMTYKEIASRMNITPRTIDAYRDSLFIKLDVKSRVGLAIYAVKNGIVTF